MPTQHRKNSINFQNVHRKGSLTESENVRNDPLKKPKCYPKFSIYNSLINQYQLCGVKIQLKAGIPSLKIMLE